MLKTGVQLLSKCWLGKESLSWNSQRRKHTKRLQIFLKQWQTSTPNSSQMQVRVDWCSIFVLISGKQNQKFNWSNEKVDKLLTRQKGLHKRLPSEVIKALACFHCFYCWQKRTDPMDQALPLGPDPRPPARTWSVITDRLLNKKDSITIFI